MIDRAELRPGNWVQFIGTDLFYIINLQSLFEGIVSRVSPIVFTEDFLLNKTDFKLDPYQGIAYENSDERKVFADGNCVISIKDGQWSFFMNMEDEWYSCTYCDFKYVHEFQNIYYWVSGKKELQLKK